jgi:hypothetical protein
MTQDALGVAVFSSPSWFLRLLSGDDLSGTEGVLE